MQEGAHTGTVNWNFGIGAAVLAVFVFFLDRATKHYFFALGESRHASVVRGVIDLVHHENYGIVANAPLPMPIILAITLVVIVLVVAGIWRAMKRRDLRATLALAIIFGGALGNLYDRLTHGFVFDWMLLFGRSAINVADIAIVIGAILYFTNKKAAHE